MGNEIIKTKAALMREEAINDPGFTWKSNIRESASKKYENKENFQIVRGLVYLASGEILDPKKDLCEDDPFVALYKRNN